MLKKGLIAGAIALGVALLLGYTTLGYYGRAIWGDVTTAASNAVPLDLKIKALEQIVKDSQNEIERNQRIIAEQEVSLNKLQRQVDEKKTELTGQVANVKRLNDDLSSNTVFVYAGKSYTKDEVTRDLESRFKVVKTLQSTVKKMEEMHTARRTALAAQVSKLNQMVAQKQQLTVQIDHLRASLATLEANTQTSSNPITNNALTEAQRLADDIADRLEVETKVSEAQGASSGPGGTIPLESAPSVSLEGDVAGFLQQYENEQRGLISLTPEENKKN